MEWLQTFLLGASGGLVVAVFNRIAFRRKHAAESLKMEAEAAKFQAEAAKFQAEAAQIRSEFNDVVVTAKATLTASKEQLAIARIVADEVLDLHAEGGALELLTKLSRAVSPGTSRVNGEKAGAIVAAHDNGANAEATLVQLGLLRKDPSGDLVVTDAGRRSIARRKLT